ncbi:hypothetical protein P691DRAFT_767203 [Macrolepiota fuliginosa MF-IS2]|uniref:Uncharacterized protein n=1 Tax=Macrolepiota fuliginosa MF-IS2 TaxID=1400762 RepID=A0A9P5WZJ6_9AGAR|nr:hypothetical protein P691DRAFT_767203 [Macrolepiota fuliginosa MF-IS2]
MAAMPGSEISERWFRDPTKSATKKACQDDFEGALKAVKTVQQQLAQAGLVHDDNHPGNLLPSTLASFDLEYVMTDCPGLLAD